MRYYRVQVALAHMGTCQTEYTTWYVATHLSAGDVWSNRGHCLAGVKQVTEVSEITAGDWDRARVEGHHAFRLPA